MNEVIRNIIVKNTSKMLDNPDEYGIYPTTEFYNNLEKEIISIIIQLQQEKQELIEWLEKNTNPFKNAVNVTERTMTLFEVLTKLKGSDK